MALSTTSAKLRVGSERPRVKPKYGEPVKWAGLFCDESLKVSGVFRAAHRLQQSTYELYQASKSMLRIQITLRWESFGVMPESELDIKLRQSYSGNVGFSPRIRFEGGGVV